VSQDCSFATKQQSPLVLAVVVQLKSERRLDQAAADGWVRWVAAVSARAPAHRPGESDAIGIVQTESPRWRALCMRSGSGASVLSGQRMRAPVGGLVAASVRDLGEAGPVWVDHVDVAVVVAGGASGEDDLLAVG
jgi:hypothetical protein